MSQNECIWKKPLLLNLPIIIPLLPSTRSRPEGLENPLALTNATLPPWKTLLTISQIKDSTTRSLISTVLRAKKIMNCPCRFPNVAITKQYAALQELNEQYEDKNRQSWGFPANNFGQNRLKWGTQRIFVQHNSALLSQCWESSVKGFWQGIHSIAGFWIQIWYGWK